MGGNLHQKDLRSFGSNSLSAVSKSKMTFLWKVHLLLILVSDSLMFRLGQVRSSVQAWIIFSCITMKFPLNVLHTGTLFTFICMLIQLIPVFSLAWKLYKRMISDPGLSQFLVSAFLEVWFLICAWVSEYNCAFS